MSPPSSFLERFSFREEYLASREAKAQKIHKILQRQVSSVKQVSLLDIGCSQGHITQKLGEGFGMVVGLDLADEVGRRPGFHFVQADGCQLPLRSATFDVILLNHVLEHVPSPQSLLDETWRVLRPGGICYLATPNRYTFLEPHYRLLFLSWLPRPLAHQYVRLARRGNCYVDRLPSYYQLRKLTRNFQVHDQTCSVLADPGLFFQADPTFVGLVRWIRWLPLWLLRLMMPLLPVYILTLRKKRLPED